MQLSPLEIKHLKEKARNQGVNIYSLWSHEIRDSRRPSSVREYVCKSKLPREIIIAVLVPFFQAQGYKGKVSIREGVEDFYSIRLTHRLQGM